MYIGQSTVPAVRARFWQYDYTIRAHGTRPHKIRAVCQMPNLNLFGQQMLPLRAKVFLMMGGVGVALQDGFDRWGTAMRLGV